MVGDVLVASASSFKVIFCVARVNFREEMNFANYIPKECSAVILYSLTSTFMSVENDLRTNTVIIFSVLTYDQMKQT